MCVVFVLWAGLVIGYIWSVWKLGRMSRSPCSEVDRVRADEKAASAALATKPPRSGSAAA